MTEATPARRAVLHTNHGDITVDLFPDHAPKTVDPLARALGELGEVGDRLRGVVREQVDGDVAVVRVQDGAARRSR